MMPATGGGEPIARMRDDRSVCFVISVNIWSRNAPRAIHVFFLRSAFMSESLHSEMPANI